MYNFTDLNERGTRDVSMSIQTVFDDKNLDKLLTDDTGKFSTLTVSGRGFLPRSIRSQEMPRTHGKREYDFTYDVREIGVKFLIEDQTNTGFRERLNQLNGLLLGSKKKLEFTDENAYFISTLQSGSLPDETSNSLVGTLTFYCSNPAKMKDEHTETINTTNTTVTVSGQSKTPWTSKTTFGAGADQFILEANTGLYVQLDYNFIQGDVLEIDYKYRKVTLNGELLMKPISLQTNWLPLQSGFMQIRASHETEISYRERYY